MLLYDLLELLPLLLLEFVDPSLTLLSLQVLKLLASGLCLQVHLALYQILEMVPQPQNCWGELYLRRLFLPQLDLHPLQLSTVILFELLLQQLVLLHVLLYLHFPHFMKHVHLMLIPAICLLHILLVPLPQLLVLSLEPLLLQLCDSYLGCLSLEEVLLLETVGLVVLEHLSRLGGNYIIRWTLWTSKDSFVWKEGLESSEGQF